MSSWLVPQQLQRALPQSTSSQPWRDPASQMNSDDEDSVDCSQRMLTIVIISLVAVCWLTSVIALIFAKPCRDAWADEAILAYDDYSSNADTEAPTITDCGGEHIGPADWEVCSNPAHYYEEAIVVVAEERPK